MAATGTLKLSAVLALVGGLLLPVLETVRRWHQMSHPEYFTYWFDDYLIGGFLVYAGWRTLRQRHRNGQLYLCAAFGAATVMMILSFIGQLVSLGQPDPAPVSPAMVAVIKGLLLAGATTGLILALRMVNHSAENHTGS